MKIVLLFSCYVIFAQCAQTCVRRTACMPDLVAFSHVLWRLWTIVWHQDMDNFMIPRYGQLYGSKILTVVWLQDMDNCMSPRYGKLYGSKIWTIVWLQDKLRMFKEKFLQSSNSCERFQNSSAPTYF